jgi:hypothetical protein
MACCRLPPGGVKKQQSGWDVITITARIAQNHKISVERFSNFLRC